MRKQVAIEESTAEDLGRVAKKNNVSRDKVISKMLEFFRVYGIDPFNYEAPHEEMTKIIKRFDQMFGFLKKQEKDILKPTLLSLATKEDAENIKKVSFDYASQVLTKTGERIDELQRENQELKSELEKTKKICQDLTNKGVELSVKKTVSEVSKMLQEVIKTLGMGGQKRDVTLSNLQEYER